MYLNSETKKEIFAAKGHQKKATDTGSAESQIALFTHRINALTAHLNTNKKDHSTRRGLLMLVGKRKKLLSYLQRNDITRYRAILADLNLRK
jgi:small subunit ribosomal protein S15